MMINYDYIFKKVFLVTDDLSTTDSTDITLALDYAGFIDFKIKNIKEGCEEDLFMFHGVVLPVNFIHEKINTLSEIFIISIDGERDSGKNYKTFTGSFSNLTKFTSLKDVVDEIEKRTRKFDDIEDLFLFIGYKMNHVELVGLDDVDDSIIDTLEKIGEITKSTLETIEAASEKLCNLPVDGNNKFSKLKKLVSYI